MAKGNERMGSSDMGNVSQVVPAIHPYISIGPEDLVGHTPQVREAAASATGHAGMMNGARALAMTAVDLLAEPSHLREAKKTFQDQMTAFSEGEELTKTLLKNRKEDKGFEQ